MARYALTSAWQRIAAAGATVEVQAAGAFEALLTTSRSPPAADADGVRLSMETRTYAALPADLYARGSGIFTGTLEVIEVGAAGGGGGGAVTAADGALATLGATSDAAAASDAGTFSLLALLKRALGYLGQVAGAVAGGAVSVAPASLSPAEGATTSGALAGLVPVGSRPAEPGALGQWYAQNQSGNVMVLVFYAGDGTTRLCTIALDPGAGQGRQGGDASWQTTFGAFKGPMTLFGTSGAQATLARQ